MRRFLRWLKHADTVCFWDEASAAFQKMLMFILRVKLNNPISLISPTMIKAGRDAGLYSQAPYQVCRLLEIKTTRPEQYAPNEVEAIRAILIKTRFNDELVRKNTLPDDYLPADNSKGSATESETPAQQSNSCPKVTQKEAKLALNNTRRLTKAEKKAVRRHNEATGERAQVVGELSPEEKRDMLTLTNPGYAFWASKGYKTFHLRNCIKLKDLTDLRGFARYEDAVRAGYSPCKQCAPSPKSNLVVSVPIEQRVRKNEEPSLLDELCDKAGFKHSYSAPEYCIETPAGKWKLIFGTRPLDVFHLHLNEEQPVDEEYHKQHRLFLSLQDTFEYIKRHDSNS